MKKFYFFIMVLCLTSLNCLYAADVLTLATTESIGAKLAAYTGTGDDVTVVVPAGYTSVEFTGTVTSNIIIPATIKNLVIKGDGTNPTLLMKGFTLPASSLTSLTVKDLILKGAVDATSGGISLGNYFAQSAVTITSVTLDNCTVANFRGVFRMNAGNNFTNVTLNNCIFRNIGSYNVFNPGGTLTNLTVTKSTFYGINGNIFALSVASPIPSPTAVTISDCTFADVDFVSGKYFIDLGVANNTTVLTITNTILGKTLSSTAKGINFGTTYTVANSYSTTDWVTSANAVTGFTAYANAQSSLFKSPSVYTSDGVGTEATVGDYTLIDKSLGNVGDPRWYPTATGVISPKASSTVISYYGAEISLNEAQDVTIYSVTGELLKSAKSVKVISVGNLSHGIYIVKAGATVQKFIVQ
jgi:hypothetical protein